jgi:hypothetical protein
VIVPNGTTKGNSSPTNGNIGLCQLPTLMFERKVFESLGFEHFDFQLQAKHM